MVNYKNDKLVSAPATRTQLGPAVPGSAQRIVQSVHVANKSSVQQSFTLEWQDASDSQYVTLAALFAVEAQSAVNPLDRPLVLESGDALFFTASVAGALDVTVSYAEYT